METVAALMTGKGTGAIATIGLWGPAAADILEKIFNSPSKFETGQITLGTININGNVIDQVLIGCEGAENFTINCHGNPLIVSDILRLLEEKGAATVSSERLLAGIYSQQSNTNSIAIESKLAMADAETLDGTKIIVNQIEGGLTKAVQSWQQTAEKGALYSPCRSRQQSKTSYLRNLPAEAGQVSRTEELDSRLRGNDKKLFSQQILDEIRTEARAILKISKKIRPLIYGCKIVLAGPPNSGKSTLLNCLTGKEKSIVTDIKGTTRDWVSAHCQLGKLAAEVFDTAGLDEVLSTKETIGGEAQRKAYEILEGADLVLVVLDINEQQPGLSKRFIEQLKNKITILVLNKCDLPAKPDEANLSADFGQAIEISAESGTGVDKLIRRIQQILGADAVDLKQAVCFTSRQERLLGQIAEARSQADMLSSIAELLNGKAYV